MALLTPDSINLLILLLGFTALTFILIYIAFEGSSDDDEEEEEK